MHTIITTTVMMITATKKTTMMTMMTREMAMMTMMTREMAMMTRCATTPRLTRITNQLRKSARLLDMCGWKIMGMAFLKSMLIMLRTLYLSQKKWSVTISTPILSI